MRLTARQNLRLCQHHSIQDESGTDDKAYRPANIESVLRSSILSLTFCQLTGCRLLKIFRGRLLELVSAQRLACSEGN